MSPSRVLTRRLSVPPAEIASRRSLDSAIPDRDAGSALKRVRARERRRFPFEPREAARASRNL